MAKDNPKAVPHHPGQIRLVGQVICATAGDAATVTSALPQHIALSRAEPGCLAFRVDQTADPLLWQVDEVFADRASFDLHQSRTKTSDWFAATGHIPRRYQVTED